MTTSLTAYFTPFFNVSIIDFEQVNVSGRGHGTLVWILLSNIKSGLTLKPSRVLFSLGVMQTLVMGILKESLILEKAF